MDTDALTDALTNLFNWIVLTLGVDMSESEMLVEYSLTPTNPKNYVDVTFTIRDRSAEALAEVDFRLLHALVIALKPAGNVTIGVVEGYETDANLSIGLEGLFLRRIPPRVGSLSDFQTLAIKRLGGHRPYENSENMHRDQSK
jgi:hypothetical protein